MGDKLTKFFGKDKLSVSLNDFEVLQDDIEYQREWGEETAEAVKELREAEEKLKVLAKQIVVNFLLVRPCPGRYSKGADHHAAKLNREKVRNLREERRHSSLSDADFSKQFGDEYGVSARTILRACKGETWKGVDML